MKPVRLCSTLNTDREEWLYQRRMGIGGSDAAAIVGLDPYRSAYQVYCDKAGILCEREDNEAMRQGRDFEQYVAGRFCEAAGKKVQRCNYILAHPDHRFLIANVDRVVVGENAVLECKTTSVYNRSDFRSGDIPPNYYVQCVHYMMVTGAEKAYLAVLVLNRAFHWFGIERNEDEINALMAAETAFWNDHVLPRREPAPDGSERAGEVIRRLYGIGSDDEVVELAGFDSRIRRYRELGDLIRKLETEQEQIKQEIQAEMKTATVGRSREATVYWRNCTRSGVDSRRLKSEAPDVYEKYLKTSAYRKFEIKEAI